jgi:hypothetical protein
VASDEEETEHESEAEQLADTDRDDLREMIREELASVIDDLRGINRATDPDPGAPSVDPHESVSMTVRDIEAATERAVRAAMGDLRKKAPAKKAAPKKSAPEPEPAPVNPPKGFWDKVRESAWK